MVLERFRDRQRHTFVVILGPQTFSHPWDGPNPFPVWEWYTHTCTKREAKRLPETHYSNMRHVTIVHLREFLRALELWDEDKDDPIIRTVDAVCRDYLQYKKHPGQWCFRDHPLPRDPSRDWPNSPDDDEAEAAADAEEDRADAS